MGAYLRTARRVDVRYSPSVVQTCIGLVDDDQKTIVREDGSLNYGYGQEPASTSASETLERNTLGFGHRLKPQFTHRDTFLDREQSYGDPGEAIVTTTERYEDTTFEWTAFAYREDGLRADVVRWSLTAEPGFGSAPSRVTLGLDGSADGLPEVLAHTAAPDEAPDEVNVAVPEPTLAAGDTREGVFVLVHEGTLDPDRVDVEWADGALEDTREYWQDLSPFQNEFEIPDEEVGAMLTACGRNILQAREEMASSSIRTTRPRTAVSG